MHKIIDGKCTRHRKLNTDILIRWISKRLVEAGIPESSPLFRVTICILVAVFHFPWYVAFKHCELKRMKAKRTDPFSKTQKLVFHNLTIKHWKLFEELMGTRGGCGGCWCMSFRLSKKDFDTNRYDGNKRKMKRIVRNGKPAGLVATLGGKPVGWIALAPREDFLKIENARTLKRIDDKPVWSIPCFFIRKEFRRAGLSKLLIRGAVKYARKKHIRVLEAYPAIPYSTAMPDAFLWIGVLSSFTTNGFKIVRQNGKSKAMVRLDL